MEKTYGTDGRHDQVITCSNGRTILIYGYGEEDGTGYDYRHNFAHRPTKEEVLDVITTHINKLTDHKILSGFVWNNLNVWLSQENQFNFKAAYDVAVQTNGSTLPIKFKLGEDEDGLPVYHTFKSMNAFADFFTGAIGFIQQTLVEGWEEKDSAAKWVDTLELGEINN